MAIILGIDPGTRVLGFGLVRMQNGEVNHVGHGVLTAPRSQDLPRRLSDLAVGLEQVLLVHKPEVVVVERVFLGKNVESAFVLGHIRGVCLSLAAQRGIKVFEYAPRQVKKGIAGNGNATKEHVQLILRNEFCLLEALPLDASDALALANYHARQWLVSDRWCAQGKGSQL